MGLTWHDEMLSTGSAYCPSIHKEPDVSFLPVRLPPGRSSEWPTLVVEVGGSELQAFFDRGARRWLDGSNGDVKLVITVKIFPTRSVVKRWAVKRWATTDQTRVSPRLGGQARACPVVTQTIIITKRSRQGKETRITGAPLTIPFDDLFIRPPRGNETNFEFDQNNLERWAHSAWAMF